MSDATQALLVSTLYQSHVQNADPKFTGTKQEWLRRYGYDLRLLGQFATTLRNRLNEGWTMEQIVATETYKMLKKHAWTDDIVTVIPAFVQYFRHLHPDGNATSLRGHMETLAHLAKV